MVVVQVAISGRWMMQCKCVLENENVEGFHQKRTEHDDSRTSERPVRIYNKFRALVKSSADALRDASGMWGRFSALG